MTIPLKRLLYTITTVLLALTFGTFSSAKAQLIYTDRDSFLSDLLIYNIIDFEDYPSGSEHVPIVGDEYAGEGVVFSSPLEPPYNQLYIESGWYHESNFLSVYNEPWDPTGPEDDDLIFDLTVSAYAFGVDIVDNGGGMEESIIVYSSSGIIYIHDSIPGSFFGIIAEEYITRVYVEEAVSDNDDIGYDNVITSDSIVEFSLELDAAYDAGTLSLDFAIGTPRSATWANYLILTYPRVQIVPLWTISLPAVEPPMEFPISFPFPSMGWIGIYTGLFTTEGVRTVELAWVDTG